MAVAVGEDPVRDHLAIAHVVLLESGRPRAPGAAAAAARCGCRSRSRRATPRPDRPAGPSSFSLGSAMKYRPTRSARASSSAEKFSLIHVAGSPWCAASCWPDRVADDLVHVGQQLAGDRGPLLRSDRSPRRPSRTPRARRCRRARRWPSTTLRGVTDLLPYCSRIVWSLGRLMPTGVIGPSRPSR